ncbi:MAG: phage scaffolding protein [Clostridiales bacterium]|nr:phage scaffolding protein [Clostridiales bacterium]MCD8215853.1 phage scaffolding protein [Clostridiales bacterium]
MKEKLSELGLTEEQISRVIEIIGSAGSGSGENSGNIGNVGNGETERLKQEIIEYKERIKELEAQSVIDDELRKAGARNVRAVRALIDFENLEIQGSKVTGLEEQIKALTAGEDTAFLFSKKQGLKGVKPAFSSGKPSKKDFKDYSYDDWDEYFKRKG